MVNIGYFLLLLGLLTACSEPSDLQTPMVLYQIAGRDEGESPYDRPVIYRIRVPEGWQHRPAPDESSIFDSRLPLAEFVIEEELIVSIHNFPISSGRSTIPPEAQVARWKRQFDRLEVEATEVFPESFGGFVGLLLEAQGEIGGERKAFLAWAMRLAGEHASALSSVEGNKGCQMRGDYTLKVSGPQLLLDKYRDQLIAVAHTFELIEEIPRPL